MELLGYIAAIFIGISLSVIGGGGSILTVPVLLYLFAVDAVTATAYSLFIVGVSSSVGSLAYFKNKLVDVKTAVVFGIPSIIAVFATRAYLVPAIPEQLFTLGSFVFTKSISLVLLFALLMIAASHSMITKSVLKTENDEAPQKFNHPLILVEGTLVGILTGLVGAGGGFLIIPALVLLSKLPMKKAVGTSLVIIAAKSLVGFWGESSETLIDWSLLLHISAFAVLGIFIGIPISKKIDGNKLKPAFGWFVLLMGMYIIFKETILKH
ncbi:sulfite exporter TauE/SafE family protein [Flavobacterium sp.]|uniref:sulfite exporter TauE/SafE family protein n=1 Tax=Flavobacterium sp. TaxID=239 RepID=UPI003B9B9130